MWLIYVHGQQFTQVPKNVLRKSAPCSPKSSQHKYLKTWPVLRMLLSGGINSSLCWFGDLRLPWWNWVVMRSNWPQKHPCCSGGLRESSVIPRLSFLKMIVRGTFWRRTNQGALWNRKLKETQGSDIHVIVLMPSIPSRLFLSCMLNWVTLDGKRK